MRINEVRHGGWILLDRRNPLAVRRCGIRRAPGATRAAPRRRGPALLIIVQFNPGQRHPDAVAVLARQGRAEARLAFAGSGPLMDETRRLARPLGVVDGVRSSIPPRHPGWSAPLLPCCSPRTGVAATQHQGFTDPGRTGNRQPHSGTVDLLKRGSGEAEALVIDGGAAR